MVAQVRYSVAGRSRGRVAPCAVYTVHVETRSVCFLVEPQNQGRRFVSGLASKPLERFSPVWPQNRWRQFLWFGLKICCDGFCWFGLKTNGDGFWRFGLKTCCDGFLQFGLKTGGDGFSQFVLKIGGRFLG